MPKPKMANGSFIKNLIIHDICIPRQTSKICRGYSLLSAYQICLSVGANCVRPRAFKERPYKQISAERLFSLPICVIIGIHRRAGACSRRNERFGATAAPRHRPTRGMGFTLCLCNTKAKLAIKQNDKQEFDERRKE